MRFATQAIHAGQEPDPTTGATIVPIYQTSTYTQEGIGRHKGYEYSRTGNPTRTALEECLAALEEGKHALAFASGLAAATAVLSILRPGDHVVAAEDLYGGTYRLFEQVLARQNIEFTYVDGRDASTFATSVRPHTRLLWVETPSNPLLRLVDIPAVAQIAHAAGSLLVVDNTFATPFLQQPLKLGADAVVHSTTKYLSGHSDVVGGAVVTSDEEVAAWVRFYQNAAGAVPGPFDCWLTLRGLKTLPVRMRQHGENALQVARFLRGQSMVEEVIYPGFSGHPQHDLVQRQMRGAGGMVTFRIRGGKDAADHFFQALRVFSYAESLGAVESLACYPCAMTHGSIPEGDRQRRGLGDGTIRLSVGLEDADDLIADLAAGLRAADRQLAGSTSETVGVGEK
ncbi:MAG: cystathionine gamma-synthase [Actinobacteria bacterium RBG_16_64_13]|nr:MAG: cystathionine gamma-synthase [Actinobacteria bacterium RBG_16_64_13]